MGLFVSNCKGCNCEIGWFLTTPKNWICGVCNTPMSEKEIEDSWDENYFRMQVGNVHRYIAEGKSAEWIASRYHPEFYAKLMAAIEKEA